MTTALLRKWLAIIQPHWKKLYGWGAVIILGASTFAWALWSARLQQGNSDQLTDGFLFENSQTFHGALFPASHTLLLKWPLFWLLHELHYSAGAYFSMTIALVLLTVGTLAYILFRIDHRPLVFGTIYLGLASSLVLVPAFISVGPTAPLSMAMLTGRNVEYVIYLAIMWGYYRAAHFRDWRFWASTTLLTILIASDHLFGTLSIGGGILLLGIATLMHLDFRKLGVLWSIGSGIAGIASLLVLKLLNTYVVHIVGAQNPYDFSNSAAFVHSVSGTLKSLLLNFGITNSAGGLSVVTLLINSATLIVIIVATIKITHNERQRSVLNHASGLSMMLLASVSAATIAYIGFDHNYQTDARYLTIVLLSGYICLAAYLRHRQLSTRLLLVSASVLIVSVSAGLISVQRHDQLLVQSQIGLRNQTIAQMLAKHPVELLVGSYWRVYPIKALTPHANQKITPLDDCFRPASSLTSTTWTKDLRQHSFAYVLSLQPTGLPGTRCTFQSIAYIYGLPTSTAVVAGPKAHPTELLLFYDQGAASRINLRSSFRPGRY